MLLAKVASRLQGVMRSQDVLARLGGDELHPAPRPNPPGKRRSRSPPVLPTRSGSVRDRGAALQHLASIGIATDLDGADDGSAAHLRRRRASTGRRGGPQSRRGVRRRAARVDPAPPRRRAGAAPTRWRPARSTAWYQTRSGSAHRADHRRGGAARWSHPTGPPRRGKFVPIHGRGGSGVRPRQQNVRAAVSRPVPRIRVAGSAFQVWWNISAGSSHAPGPVERLTNLLERTGCGASLIGLDRRTRDFPDVRAAR